MSVVPLRQGRSQVAECLRTMLRPSGHTSADTFGHWSNCNCSRPPDPATRELDQVKDRVLIERIFDRLEAT